MKSLYISLTLVLVSLSLFSQPSWSYYAQDYWVQDVKVIDDYVFMSSPSGFNVFDTNTKERQFFQSVNSPLRGSLAWELLAKDNYVWLALDEGGVAKYSFD